MKGLTFFTWSSRGKGYKKRGCHPGAVVLGLIWAFSLSIAVVLGVGVYVFVKASPVYYLANIMLIIACSSTFIGGLVSGAVINRQGLLHGLMVGGIYGIIFAIIALYWRIYSFGLGLILVVLLLVLSSIIGGITGVNLPNRKQRQRRAL